MGFGNVTVWDYDTVEEHNIPNQYFPLNSIGQLKTEALKSIVKEMTGIEIKTRNKPFDKDDLNQSGIVISAVDNMETRMEIFNACTYNSLFIDGRMGGISWSIYCAQPMIHGDRELYKSEWYPTSEATPLKCTEKAIMFNAMSIASEMANICKTFIADNEYPKYIRRNMNNYNIEVRR